MENKNSLKDRKEEIEELVLSSQAGNHDDFAKLYDIFVDAIYRYIFYRVNSDDAEDLVETVFLKVWEKIDQYKKKKNNSFSAWIFRIAHNLLVDHYRSSKDKLVEELSVQIPDPSRQHNPIRVTQGALDNLLLRKALKNMKKQYRDIVIHKFINELSNKEIAEILDKSEGSLRILQFRALKALKKELLNLGMKY